MSGIDSKPYRDKDFLEVAYCTREQTTEQIAKVFGVHPDTIRRYLKKYNLSKGSGYGAGGKNPNTRLSKADVRDIRERYANGERPGSIAQEYGYRPTSIYQIVTGRVWQDAGGPIID